MNPAQDKAWRRLISAARKASNAHSTHEREFAAAEIRKALKATWKARGTNDALGRPLVVLLGLARGWAAMDGAGRVANAQALAAAASAARVSMGGSAKRAAGPPDPPARPFRADIDG